jgi:hypothetical protein
MRNDLSPYVSALLEKFVPEHIRANYPQFVDFVRAYFDFLEETHGSGYYQNTLPQQRDIRTQEQEFLSLIQKEIGLFVPREYAASPAVFYDRISDLWRSKGSEDAIRTFFRLFLDDAVEIYYPWNQVLKPSDGRWIVEDKIRVVMISGNGEDFEGRIIQQLGSDSSARVDRVERKVYTDGIIFELTLVKGSQNGEFDSRERIIADGGLEAEIYRSLSDIQILSGGTGYRRGDRIRVEGFEGFTFTAYVSGVEENTGAITDVRISNYGAGNTPDVVLDSNNPPQYYFEDFLLYRTSDGVLVGPSINLGNITAYLRDTQIELPVVNNEIIVEGRVEEIIIPLDELKLVIPGRTENTEIAVDVTFTSPVFEIDTVNGSGAQFLLAFGSVVTTPGYYQGVRGQLSESIVLQDSRFYQKFSYEVSTNFSTRRWIDALKRTVHPGGTEVFGNIRIKEILDSRVKNAFVYTAKTEPSEYILSETPRLVNTPLGFSQNYTIPEQVFFSEAYVGTEYFNDPYVDATESRTQVFDSEDEEEFIEQ